ncbi:hypothetical protein IMAU60049_02930 [Lactiplantibacillus plantarum]|nr:hypothetical protein [Lactiplantibacillus plantarum]
MIYDISIIIMLALFLLSFVVFVRWILKKIFGFNIHNLSCIRVAFISLLSGVLIVGLGYQLRTSDQKRIDEQNESKVALESKKKTKAKSESKAASESKKRARAKSESKAASESKKRARAKSESKAALESKKRARAKSESKAASENKKRARAKSKSEVSSAKKKKKQHSDTYQNIETIFNMHTIKYLSNRRIFNKGSAVALRDFKVIDFGADKMKQYHVLIAPKNASKTYFLLVFGDNIYKGRITYSSKITVLGSLNGKSRVNDSQINSGIAQRYLGKRDILVLIDRIQVKN